VYSRRESREIVQEGSVCGHDHGRKWWIVGLSGRSLSSQRIGGFVVGEDLVDAEGDVCELCERLDSGL
jgi:hypothetical protein